MNHSCYKETPLRATREQWDRREWSTLNFRNGDWVSGFGDNGQGHVNQPSKTWLQSHCLEQNPFQGTLPTYYFFCFCYSTMILCYSNSMFLDLIAVWWTCWTWCFSWRNTCSCSQEMQVYNCNVIWSFRCFIGLSLRNLSFTWNLFVFLVLKNVFCVEFCRLCLIRMVFLRKLKERVILICQPLMPRLLSRYRRWVYSAVAEIVYLTIN